jgi:hypothetical protein
MSGVREKMALFTCMHVYWMPKKEIERHQRLGLKIELVTLTVGGFVTNWFEYWRGTYEPGYLDGNTKPYDAHRLDQIHKALKRREP